jgi:putative ABC transport system permease protein
MSLQNIKANKLRSFLTMLGIVIGVASVIGLVTMVKGATDSVIGKLSDLGAGTLNVNAVGTALKQGLSESDLDRLRGTEGVSGIAPTASMNGAASLGTEVYDKVSISGYDVVYFEHNDILDRGRIFNNDDMNGDVKVCIVDADFAKNVFKTPDVLGRQFKLNGYEYIVVGVRKDDESLFSAMYDTSDRDGTVIVPYKNVLRMSGKQNVSSVEVYIAEGYESTTAEDNLRSVLDGIYNDADNSYSIINMESLMDTMSTVTDMMTAMLAGIASIALVVGGIGIMNMMLVSVSERTKEIGLRKALGAEPVRIQMQFLIESIVLSMIGGIIGIGLGLLIAFVGAVLMKIDFRISYSAIALGTGFSAAVGIIFGWMPAKRASQLNPIDALRSE